jgi:hypothetical protein
MKICVLSSFVVRPRPTNFQVDRFRNTNVVEEGEIRVAKTPGAQRLRKLGALKSGHMAVDRHRENPTPQIGRHFLVGTLDQLDVMTS